jgi:3-hydroxy acid dehydrogenase / malonic semialdehyde reductase
MNQNILVTGSSSGIGKACAERFAQNGDNVILCARRLEKLKEIKNDLENIYKIKAHAVTLDIRNTNDIYKFVKNLPLAWQRIDILINNAGTPAGQDNLPAMASYTIDSMIQTNVNGLIHLTKAILPQMIERNSGHIFNIGSTAAHLVTANSSVYCASKHAVKAVTEGLRHDLLGKKIRVSMISPGLVETEIYKALARGNEKQAGAIFQETVPLKPEDIAETVFYAAQAPWHVNIDEIVILPVYQAGAQIHRI